MVNNDETSGKGVMVTQICLGLSVYGELWIPSSFLRLILS